MLGVMVTAGSAEVVDVPSLTPAAAAWLCLCCTCGQGVLTHRAE